MENFVTWGNFRGAEFSDGSGLHMLGFVAADNKKSGLAVKENTEHDNFEADSLAFVNATVIGRSNSHSSRTQCTSHGIETPWKKAMFEKRFSKIFSTNSVYSQL